MKTLCLTYLNFDKRQDNHAKTLTNSCQKPPQNLSISAPDQMNIHENLSGYVAFLHGFDGVQATVYPRG